MEHLQTETQKEHLEYLRKKATLELYKNRWPTLAIAELLDTTLKQIEEYLGKERRVYGETRRK